MAFPLFPLQQLKKIIKIMMNTIIQNASMLNAAGVIFYFFTSLLSIEMWVLFEFSLIAHNVHIKSFYLNIQ